tara:strand:+ start:2070 stop:2351 length:282 start_codon:yes stop_codon:yes gene_type:complete
MSRSDFQSPNTSPLIKSQEQEFNSPDEIYLTDVSECPNPPKKKTEYTVFDSNTNKTIKPVCLGTLMGALEAYHRGMQLDDEEKECLRSAGYDV